MRAIRAEPGTKSGRTCLYLKAYDDASIAGPDRVVFQHQRKIPAGWWPITYRPHNSVYIK